MPAFRILTDAVLKEICATLPETEADLLSVRGMGPSLAQRYGGSVLGIVRTTSSSS